MSWLGIINWVLCMLNLAFYAWGSHLPSNLAVGIFCGLIAISYEIKHGR